MSDRSKARAFGEVFKIIASRHESYSSHRTVTGAIALEIWRSAERSDFTPDQMGCDEALVALGLASENRVGSVTREIEGPYRYATRDGELKC